MHQPRATCPTALPEYPWVLICLLSKKYIVDYFSRYPEVVKLPTTTSESVIKALKSMFAHFGDCCKQQSPTIFLTGIHRLCQSLPLLLHHQHSLCYPQSNGQAEHTLKTVKKLLKDSTNPCLSLSPTVLPPHMVWCLTCRAVDGETNLFRSTSDKRETDPTVALCQ